LQPDAHDSEEIQKARNAFARSAKESLGLGNGQSTRTGGSSPNSSDKSARPGAKATLKGAPNASLQRKSAQQIRGAAASAQGAKQKKAASGPAKSAAKPTQPNAKHSRPSSENAAPPLDAVRRPGAESTAALAQLRSNKNLHPDVLAFGETIYERTHALRTRAAQNTARTTARLKGAAASQRNALKGAIQSSQSAVHATIAGTKQRIEGNAGTAEAAIGAQGEAAHARNTSFTDKTASLLGKNLHTASERAGGVFTEAETKVQAAGEKEGERARQHTSDLARRATDLGRTEAANYRRSESDTDLAEKKAAAVSDVASQFAEQIRNNGEKLQSAAREQAQTAREKIAEKKEPTVAGFTDAAPGAVDGIRKFLGSVDGGIDTAVQQGKQQVVAARSGVHTEVDKLGQSNRARGQSLAAEGEANLDAALVGGLLAQAKLAGQAGQMIDNAGSKSLGSLADSAAKARPSAPEITSPLVTRKHGAPSSGKPQSGIAPKAQHAAIEQLDRVGPNLDAAAERQSTELARPLGDTARRTGDAGKRWSQETKGQTDRIASSFAAGMSRIEAGTRTGLDGMLDSGHAQAGAEADRISSAVDSNIAKIKESMSSSTGEATTSLRGGVTEGLQGADASFGELPGAMRNAAAAQESLLGRVGHWIWHQLSDTWKAFTSMFSLGFLIDLAVGIAVAVLVAIAIVAIAALIGVTGGLALAVVVGVAAGAAGFAAGQMSANVRNGDPLMKGVGGAAILGAFVGGTGAAAAFGGFSLAAGTVAVMFAAGVGTVVSNMAEGRDWDENLIPNILIIGLFHAIVKAVGDRISSKPSPKTQPIETDQQGSQYKPPPADTPVIVVKSADHVVASELVADPQGGWTCSLYDSKSGARFGVADIESTPESTAEPGPSLSITPKKAYLPDRTLVSLEANGFSWTVASLRAVIKAYRQKFGKVPPNMNGTLAMGNLLNFQKVYAQLRAANPKLSIQSIAEQAARSISFGKHRIALGYGRISVRFGNFADVSVGEGNVLQNVPRWVEVIAERSSVNPPEIPPPHTDDDND